MSTKMTDAAMAALLSDAVKVQEIGEHDVVLLELPPEWDVTDELAATARQMLGALLEGAGRSVNQGIILYGLSLRVLTPEQLAALGLQRIATVDKTEHADRLNKVADAIQSVVGNLPLSMRYSLAEHVVAAVIAHELAVHHHEPEQ